MSTEIESVDTVVVGAGVVGLAVAAALARAGHEVVILEAQDAIGTQTSSRNSEVVHGGLYYPTGSLKARLCVEGRRLLYARCERHGIAHRRCGKLVVANGAAQEDRLHALRAQALANGVEGLSWLSGEEARARAPALACTAALHSSVTGIVDSHGLMLSLLGEAEDRGAMLASNTPVMAGEVVTGGIELRTGGAHPMRLRARQVVNAAGHGAPALATGLAGLASSTVPRAFLCKGSYFTLAGRSPFTQLIYPMPEAAGLGVHLTLDLAGQARFGPDTEWVDEPELQVDARRAEAFEAAIRSWWPGLPAGALQPAYAGLRPKISGPHEAAADFRIDGPQVHGVPGLVNLYGIESPGLTACLAIAREVSTRLAG